MSKKEVYEIVERGMAEVVNEPRGDHSLEGFALGDKVEYEVVKPYSHFKDRPAKKHCRVYPVHGGGWYDTCDYNVFHHYFRKDGK